MLRAVTNATNQNDLSHDIYQLNKLVRGAGYVNSEAELNAFFGELKSAVILVDSSFKITYFNRSALNLIHEESETLVKGSQVIEYIKQVIGPTSLITFYENLINKKDVDILEGFKQSRIEKLILNPIGNEGFVIKILLNELFTVSTSNFFRYFPGVPIACPFVL
jgi:PAS domain-containing protein